MVGVAQKMKFLFFENLLTLVETPYRIILHPHYASSSTKVTGESNIFENKIPEKKKKKKARSMSYEYTEIFFPLPDMGGERNDPYDASISF